MIYKPGRNLFLSVDQVLHQENGIQAGREKAVEWFGKLQEFGLLLLVMHLCLLGLLMYDHM